MIARVPLFAGLDKDGLTALSRRLHAVVALPNEKIIATGSRPDAMYFIAAGEVTVEREGGGGAQLHEGDFFGEMGLLDNKPRNADVISDGYSHLLTLSKRDFNRLLEQHPEIRTAIAAVAAQRNAASAPGGT
jgi:CPA1 family monovalent cation:H+ antiporter